MSGHRNRYRPMLKQGGLRTLLANQAQLFMRGVFYLKRLTFEFAQANDIPLTEVEMFFLQSEKFKKIEARMKLEFLTKFLYEKTEEEQSYEHEKQTEKKRHKKTGYKKIHRRISKKEKV